MKQFNIWTLALGIMLAVSVSAKPVIWKVAGKSEYGDAPPNLRLQNVQKFNPRTGKLSAIINERAGDKRQQADIPPPETTEIIEPEESDSVELTMLPPQEEISPEEMARRQACKTAQEQWVEAKDRGESNMMAYEDMVFQHCVSE